MMHVGDCNASMSKSPTTTTVTTAAAAAVAAAAAAAAAANSYQQSCIRMTLDNADLWRCFYRIGTEMIVTKHGRRMFPHCIVSVTGLQPSANYVILMDLVRVDGYKHKWKEEQWMVAGQAEPHPPHRTYMHPDSPALGSHWMNQSLSFLKMKLTNNTLDQQGHIIVHSMHRYYPRFQVIQTDNPSAIRWDLFPTFSFPETTFTTVTAYQNPEITQLKIDHNPFAKGFRYGGTHTHSKNYRTYVLPTVCPPAKRAAFEQLNVKRPQDLQRMPSTSESGDPQRNRVSTGQLLMGARLSAWAQGRDPSEPLDLHEYDYSCDEQMVPASVPYQPYRLPNPSKDGDARYSHPGPRPLAAPEHGPQQHGHPHPYRYNNTADWSQYSLFPYSCW